MSEKRPVRGAQGNCSEDVTQRTADAQSEAQSWACAEAEGTTRRATPLKGQSSELDQPIPASSQDTTVELSRQAAALAAELQPQADADATIELPARGEPVFPAALLAAESLADATPTAQLSGCAPADGDAAVDSAANEDRRRSASVRLAAGEPLDLHSDAVAGREGQEDEKTPSSLRLAPGEPLDLHSQDDLGAGTLVGELTRLPADSLLDPDSSDLEQTVVNLPEDLRRITSAPTVVVADMIYDPSAPTFKAEEGLLYEPDSARLDAHRDTPTVRHEPDAPTIIDLTAIREASEEQPDPDDTPTPPSLPPLHPDGSEPN